MTSITRVYAHAEKLIGDGADDIALANGIRAFVADILHLKKEAAALAASPFSFNGIFDPVLRSVGLAAAETRTTIVVAPGAGRMVAAIPARACRISPAKWRRAGRPTDGDRVGAVVAHNPPVVPL
jgi:hypothetical protein